MGRFERLRAVRLTLWQRLLLTGLLIALSSQVYLAPGAESFRISASVILFPVLLMTQHKQERWPLAGAATWLVVLLFRSGWALAAGMEPLSAVARSLPGAVFYLAYDCYFILLTGDRRQVALPRLIMAIFTCDLMANLTEVWMTFLLGLDRSNPPSFYLTLVEVALVRMLAAMALLWWLGYYRKLLLVDEHERRYQRLFLMTAQLKNELYFLKKGAEEIEVVMSKAYRLYERLEEIQGIPQELRSLALDITKDIHEIKKDDLRVLRGLEDGVEEVYDQEEMKWSDLVTILEASTRHMLGDRPIQLECHTGHDFSTRQHYRLLSVIKNLITNAAEAIIAAGTGGTIRLDQARTGAEMVFTVEDDGPGIPERARGTVFQVGYSTKFDPVTGDINRGVGLVAVKSITEEFGGSVTLETELGRGTRFTVRIPCDALEEETKDEDLHH